jgi:hypothetical protein
MMLYNCGIYFVSNGERIIMFGEFLRIEKGVVITHFEHLPKGTEQNCEKSQWGQLKSWPRLNWTHHEYKRGVLLLKPRFNPLKML